MPACGWSVSSCPCGSVSWDSYPAEVQATASALAIHHMWAATGRRYGLCEIVVMPCNFVPRERLYQTYPVEYSPFGGGGWTGPYMGDGGEWHNSGCGAGCTCRARCEVELDGPVYSVTSVTADGVLVAPSAYEVHDKALLVRTDGQCWPTCQTYGTEVPGFVVAYGRGEPMNATTQPAIQAATERLACEYAKACVGGDCVLPERLTSLTRQGVSIEVAQSDDEVFSGLTGIPSVDRVIASENPGRLPSRPMVTSPDLHPARMITWP
jgi:hypothetical protein